MPKEMKHPGILVFSKNSLGYALALCSIIFEFVFAIKVLDCIDVGALMGISCVLNIILLFLLFSVAVKVNVYKENWAKTALAIAVYAIVRSFFLVPFVLKPYQKAGFLSLMTLLEGLFLFFSGVVSIISSRRRETYMSSEEGRSLLKGEA